MEGIQVIGFDADDTLWVNETYFLGDGAKTPSFACSLCRRRNCLG